jgi:bifunctional non-homologous end joining protein LigD
LDGKKLRGEYILVRTKQEKGNAWLLFRKRALSSTEQESVEPDRSVISGRTMEEVEGPS